jgi:lysozyme
MNQAIELIKKYEGFRANSYVCPAGVSTIGYGSTYYANNRPVRLGETITHERAEQLLWIEISKLATVLAMKIPTWKSMTSNQRQALVSFAYNFGPNFYNSSGFASISKLCRTQLDWHDPSEVHRVFGLYCKANGKILLGLQKRRASEADLWLAS